MDHSIQAAELFLNSSNCAQAIVVAFTDLTGMDPHEAARLSSPFGGGMGRMREVCGAVSGMLMVLGQLYGYEDPGEEDCHKAAHYALVQELANQFREENSSILCRDLLDNPPSDPHPSPRTAQYYAERPCARFVMSAARILDKYIEEHPIHG